MKIYFEDGALIKPTQLPECPNVILDAKNGTSACLDILDECSDSNKKLIVYTNFILAFNNKYAWNEELEAPEIYVRAGEHMVFTRIDQLTKREIRRAHNLVHLYLGGEFGA